MIAHIKAVAFLGVDALAVDVQAHLAGGVRIMLYSRNKIEIRTAT